jgi:hypothetical protein
MKYKLRYKELTKKCFSRRIAILLVATFLVSALGAGVIYAGLATRDVGKISGELVITDEAGVKQAVLSASQSIQTGQASVEIKKDGVRIFTASATVKATSGGEAAGGITALMLFLTGRQPVDRPTFSITNIQYSGDLCVIKDNGDAMISWWDAQAKLAFNDYRSPRPSLEGLGKLQLNAWTLRPEGENEQVDASFLILYFDPADPTKIIGGTLNRSPEFGPFSTFKVVSGSLQEDTNTPAPGDFVLLCDDTTGVFS